MIEMEITILNQVAHLEIHQGVLKHSHIIVL